MKIEIKVKNMPNTEENLATAFAGESQANRKYLAFSKKADQEKLPNIAKMFRAIAEAETVHALNHIRAMEKVKSTVKNLEAAKEGEHYEVTEMYPPMIDTAKAEGNKNAERTFTFAIEVEKVHRGLYDEAINAVKDGKDIKAVNYYVCPVCGNTFEGEDLPDNCPVCKAKKELFKKID